MGRNGSSAHPAASTSSLSDASAIADQSSTIIATPLGEQEISPVTILPHDVIEKLAELDLELSEGDITQKGYEKKRRKLLVPFMTAPEGSGGGSGKVPSVTELVTQRQQSDDPSLHRQPSVASSIGQPTDQPTPPHQQSVQ